MGRLIAANRRSSSAATTALLAVIITINHVFSRALAETATSGPTQAPSASPTLAASSSSSSASVSIGILSLHSRPRANDASASAVINPGSQLGLQGVVSSDSVLPSSPSWTWSWSSPNTSVQLRSNNSDYLLAQPLFGSLWQGGGTYVFELQVQSGRDVLGSSRVLIRVNQAPHNGSLSARPVSGVALTTPFTLRATGWADADEDLPLLYSFSAQPAAEMLVPLSGCNTSTVLQTFLPSGPAVAISVQVTDSLGASCSVSAPAAMNVTALSSYSPALSDLLAVLNGSTPSSPPSCFYSSLLTATEAITHQAASTGTTEPLQVLALLTAAGRGDGWGPEAAALLAYLLQTALLLAHVETADPQGRQALASMAVAVLGEALGKTCGGSAALGQAVVQALSSALAAAPGLRPSVSEVVGQLVDLLSSSVGLADDGEALVFQADQLGVRVDRRYVSSTAAVRGVRVPLPLSSGRLELPSASVTELRQDVCGSSLIVQSVVWPPSSSSSSTPSSSSLPDGGAVSGALTSPSAVVSVRLKTACNATATPSPIRRAHPLTTAIVLDLPSDRLAELAPSRTLSCAKAAGSPGRVEVTCFYDREGQRSVLVDCSDPSRDSVRYQCPVLGRCSVFNESEGGGQWSSSGCETGLEEGGSTACSCYLAGADVTLLPSFGRHASQVMGAIVGLQARPSFSGGGGGGVAATLGVLYATLGLGLLALHLQKRREPHKGGGKGAHKAGDSTVLQTKAFRSITNLLASDARRRRIIATVVPPPPTATIRAAAPRLDIISLDSSSGSSIKSARERAAAAAAASSPKKPSVPALIEATVQRRLSKLQSLRQPVRLGPYHHLFLTGWTRPPPPLPDRNNKVTAAAAEPVVPPQTNKRAGNVAPALEAVGAASPRTQPSEQQQQQEQEGLSGQQQLLLVFINLLGTLVLSLIFVDAVTQPLGGLHGSIARLSPQLALVLGVVVQSLQQNVVTEPLHWLLQLLLHVISKEERTAATVAEQVVGRDLAFSAPKARELSGPLFVPHLRITIIQMELVRKALSDPNPAVASAAWDATALRQADPSQRLAVLRLLSQYIRRLKLLLEQEYYMMCEEKELENSWALRHAESLHDRLQLRFDSLTRPVRRLKEFRANPLEPLDQEAKVARLFDQWVVAEVCGRPASDLLRRLYYQLFVAEVHDHVEGQSFFLPCYRLLACHVLVACYVIGLSAAILVLAAAASPATATSALYSMVSAVAFNELVLSPFLNVAQRSVLRRVVQSLESDIQASKSHFDAWFRYMNEVEEAEVYVRSSTSPVGQRKPPGRGGRRSSGGRVRLAEVPTPVEEEQPTRQQQPPPQPSGEAGAEGEEEEEEEKGSPSSFEEFSNTVLSPVLLDRLSEMDAQYGQTVRGRLQQTQAQQSPLTGGFAGGALHESFSSSLSSSAGSSQGLGGSGLLPNMGTTLRDTKPLPSTTRQPAISISSSKAAKSRWLAMPPLLRAALGLKSKKSSSTPALVLDEGSGGEGQADGLDSSAPLPFVSSSSIDSPAEQGGEEQPSDPPATTSSGGHSFPTLLPIRPLLSPSGDAITADGLGGAARSGGNRSPLLLHLGSSSNESAGRPGALREKLGLLGTSSSSIDRSESSGRSRGGARPVVEEDEERFLSTTGRVSDALEKLSGSLATLPTSITSSATRALQSAASKLMPYSKRPSAVQEAGEDEDEEEEGSSSSSSGAGHSEDQGESDGQHDGRQQRRRHRRRSSQGSRSSGSEGEEEGEGQSSTPTLSATWVVQKEVRGVTRELSRSNNNSGKAAGGGSKKGDSSKGTRQWGEEQQPADETTGGKAGRKSRRRKSPPTAAVEEAPSLIMARLVPRRSPPSPKPGAWGQSTQSWGASTLSGGLQATWRAGSLDSSSGGGPKGKDDEDDDEDGDWDPSLTTRHARTLRSNSLGGGGGGTIRRRRKNSLSSTRSLSRSSSSAAVVPDQQATAAAGPAQDSSSARDDGQEQGEQQLGHHHEGSSSSSSRDASS